MAVFQVLSKVIGSVEFLCLVAFTKLVHTGEVIKSTIPIRLWKVWKLLPAITACVELRASWA